MIQRFDTKDVPEHGRPMIGRLVVPDGQIEIRVDREDRSLWLYFLGKRGGDLGHMAFAARRAVEVFRWTELGFARGTLAASRMAVAYRDGKLRIRGPRPRVWSVPAEDMVELAAALRAWASLAYGQTRGEM